MRFENVLWQNLGKGCGIAFFIVHHDHVTCDIMASVFGAKIQNAEANKLLGFELNFKKCSEFLIFVSLKP